MRHRLRTVPNSLSKSLKQRDSNMYKFPAPQTSISMHATAQMEERFILDLLEMHTTPAGQAAWVAIVWTLSIWNICSYQTTGMLPILIKSYTCSCTEEPRKHGANVGISWFPCQWSLGRLNSAKLGKLQKLPPLSTLRQLHPAYPHHHDNVLHSCAIESDLP